jgi:O-succinylbenzoic acid--CoA ligase
MIVGGENEQNIRKRTFETKLKSFETYGMTETITHIAAKQVGERAFQFYPISKSLQTIAIAWL